MKNRIKVPNVLELALLSCLLLMACSQEEPLEGEALDFITTNSQNQGNRNSYTNCTNIACDDNYVFPTGFGGEVHIIEYDTSLSMAEIHCIRHSYFVCYTDLKVSVFDPSGSDYIEAWVRDTYNPDDDFDTSVCNDPRVNSSNCDD